MPFSARRQRFGIFAQKRGVILAKSATETENCDLRKALSFDYNDNIKKYAKENDPMPHIKLELGNLEVGKWRHLTRTEVERLRR